MKKKIIISLLCIFIIIIAFIIVIIKKNNDSNIFAQLSKTKEITVLNLIDRDNIKEKKISNSDEIDKVIKIIKDAKEMPKDQNIPYELIPDYRLKMIDQKGKTITEITYYIYEDISWISFDNEDKHYTIDDSSLLKIIDTNNNQKIFKISFKIPNISKRAQSAL